MRLILAAAAAAFAAAALACAATAPAVSYSVMPAALTPIASDHNKARDFGKVFCSTLPHFYDADGRSWGECSKYLDVVDGGGPLAPLTAPAALRFLFVGGFGGDCLKDVRAFGPSIDHLNDVHHLAVEPFSVAPFASSEENAKSIAKHIDEAWTADKTRKFVLIGYDKGAADLFDALRVLDAAPTKVAALVTIAGVVGGLWWPDDQRLLMLPGQPWIAPSCPGNVQDGVASMARDVRQSVMRGTGADIPRYSLVASSDLESTSVALKPGWKRLSAIAREQDGVVVAWEGVLPDAKYLGTARADHWAVALPFEESGQAFKAITRDRFPRDALFEAVVRFVAADLPAPAPSPAPK